MGISDLKNWDLKTEEKIAEDWKNAELFLFDKSVTKPIFSIDTPPPYVNNPIHIGQAVTYCYMDFFARYKRMKGFQVIFPLGLDNNGLPIEMGAEKKFGISAFDVDRDKFVSLCKQLLGEAGTATKDTFSRLGISFSSYKEGEHIGSIYQTDSPNYRKITQATFIDLYKKRLVYEDKRINNWDPKLRTTIADSEIDYKDLPSTFNDIKWKIKDSDEEIIIATTRPELICSCGMVIFHPDDERYKHLDGKIAISPIFGKEIPIKAHPLADINKGTGIVMMCSAGDLSDIQFFREQKIQPIISINMDGTMNSNACKYMGLKVKQAREKILEDLKEMGLLIKQETITHRTPVSERSGAEIEFIEMPEFYLKQLDYKEDMKCLTKELNFYPEFAQNILLDWINSVAIDWPISRRRFYATPIPLWHAKFEERTLVALPVELKYYEPWKDSVESNFEVFENNKKIGTVADFTNLKWEGETRVFDTWMDSSISELVMLKYKQDMDFFNKAYPASLRPQGKEIIRTWLYYTVLRGYFETGKLCFKDAWINQHIVDSKGFKMSKSKGNGIDPLKLLDSYGSESIRFWAATEGDLSKQDLKCSEDRISAEKKTINKILNLAKFVKMFEKPTKKPKLTKLDELFVNYIDSLTNELDKNYSSYDFYNPALKLRTFIWTTFASHYVEIIKNRAYNQDKTFSDEEQKSACWSLYYIFERLLFLLYPIIPKITSFIGNDFGIDLLHSTWPVVKSIDYDYENEINSLIEFNSSVWKTKKDNNISLKESISGITIPENLSGFEKDLIAAHNIH